MGASRSWAEGAMRWRGARLAGLALAAWALSGCSGAGRAVEVGALALLDCRADSPACPELSIAGDVAATREEGEPSPFRGFADASLRRDPASGRLWMAYSWPTVHELPGGGLAPSVETHLASSDDGGASWSFERVLFPSEPGVDEGGSLEPGHVGHEVPNLLPLVAADGTVDWVGVRLDYFLPDAGGFRRRPTTSFRIVVSRAASPALLAEGPAVTLASAVTAPGWGAALDLSELAPELGKCALWNEPALAGDRERIYLALRCLAFEADLRTPAVAESDLVVFSAAPAGEPAAWSWSYEGRLAGGAEAVELGGRGLTQLELAEGRDGGLLAIVTPDDWSAELREFLHFGCRAVEVESLSPPRLARGAAGELVVRASVDASDLAPLGPGSCGYDPASATGIVFARRVKSVGELVSTLHATGLRP